MDFRSRVCGGSVAALCFLAAGFQAFEVQLVLRQALPDIWTVLRDQGVSARPAWGTSVPPSFLSHWARSDLGERSLSLPLPPPPLPSCMKNHFSLSPRIQGPCLYFSFQVIVKKVSKQHRWYLENTSCDRESCWKEKILLSARGFSVFFQMLVKAQKVGKTSFLSL